MQEGVLEARAREADRAQAARERLDELGDEGVPRGALVVLTGMLAQFGLPLEGAALLLGIDQIMDMGRTAVNVMGNCIATAVVARWEGEFDDERMRAFAAGGDQVA